MRSWLDALFFSNLFIALCAAMAVEQTYLQLGLGWHWDLLTLCVGTATFAQYNFQRLVNLRVLNRETLTPPTIWLARNGRWMLVLTVIALLIAVVTFIQLSREIWLPVIVIFIVSALYAVPIGKFRLREVGLIKLLLIALIWGLVTVTLPMHHAGMEVEGMQHLWLLAQRVAFIAALTLPFDIRDILMDKAYNLKTIPSLIGPHSTQWVCIMLLWVMCAFEGLRQLQDRGSLDWILGAIVLSATISTVAILNQKRWEGRYYYLGMLDGMIVLQVLLVGFAWLLA